MKVAIHLHRWKMKFELQLDPIRHYKADKEGHGFDWKPEREKQKTNYVNYLRCQYCRPRSESGVKSHRSARLNDVKTVRNRAGLTTEVVFQAYHTGVL